MTVAPRDREERGLKLLSGGGVDAHHDVAPRNREERGLKPACWFSCIARGRSSSFSGAWVETTVSDHSCKRGSFARGDGARSWKPPHGRGVQYPVPQPVRRQTGMVGPVAYALPSTPLSLAAYPFLAGMRHQREASSANGMGGGGAGVRGSPRRPVRLSRVPRRCLRLLPLRRQSRNVRTGQVPACSATRGCRLSRQSKEKLGSSAETPSRGRHDVPELEWSP